MDKDFIVELINTTEELADLKAKVSVLKRFIEKEFAKDYVSDTARNAAQIFGWEFNNENG